MISVIGPNLKGPYLLIQKTFLKGGFTCAKVFSDKIFFFKLEGMGLKKSQKNFERNSRNLYLFCYMGISGLSGGGGTSLDGRAWLSWI